MARAILIIGEPGTGKSRAIRDLNPAETVVIKPNRKEFPFKGGAKKYQVGKNVIVTTHLPTVGKTLMEINDKFKKVKNVVIEDITHYFSKRTIDERRVTGYGKWLELAASIKQNIIDKEVLMRDDLTLFIIGHVDEKKDKFGKPELSLQTPGKLLDKSILIPSYFTYMFHTDLLTMPDGTMQYRFLTNRTEFKLAKTPEDMFPLYIANNYELIKRYIISYQTDTKVNLEGITEDINVLQDTLQYIMPEAETVKSGSDKEVVEGVTEVSPEITDDGMSAEVSLEEAPTEENPGSADTSEVSI